MDDNDICNLLVEGALFRPINLTYTPVNYLIVGMDYPINTLHYVVIYTGDGTFSSEYSFRIHEWGKYTKFVRMCTNDEWDRVANRER